MNESETGAAASGTGENLPDALDLDDVTEIVDLRPRDGDAWPDEVAGVVAADPFADDATEIVGAGVVAADPFADDVTEIVDLRHSGGDAGFNEVADDVTELVRRDVAAAAPDQSGFDRATSSTVPTTIPPEISSVVPTAISAGIPPTQSSQGLWEPPRRPRSPEPEIAPSRTRSSAGLLLATVVLLLAVIAALIIYIAVSGDTQTDSPSNEPVVEVNEDG